MTVRIGIEDPRSRQVEALLRASDDYALSLYPIDSCYLMSAEELATDDVVVVVARDAAAIAEHGDATTTPALGMAALVDRGDGSGELKRLFVHEDARGRRVATALMDALEQIARDRGVHTLQLETGPRQPAAIALYELRGYERIENFGPYAEDDFSLCMQKRLSSD
jgi:putative acetyltransferase